MHLKIIFVYGIVRERYNIFGIYLLFFCTWNFLFSLHLIGNHSCEPNAEVTFPYNNSTLVLVAMTDIAENEVCFVG